MLAVLEPLFFVYAFFLGLKLCFTRPGDLRQLGIVLAFLTVPAFVAERVFPGIVDSKLGILGIEIGLAWAARTFSLILLGAILVSLFLSWLRKLQRGEEVLAFHRMFLKLGIVLIATPIALKVHDPTLDFGKVLTSAAVGSVIFGFALQRPLGTLFSGMGNELDNVLQRGEFVQIGTPTGPRGFVVAKTWRGIQLETLDSETIFIPNEMVFTVPVINFDRPTDLVRRRIVVTTTYKHPPAVVKETLYGVFAAEPAIQREPAPLVRTKDFLDHGVQTEVCYWIRGMREDDNIAERMRTSIWYAFKERGIEIAVPTRTILPQDPVDRARLEESENQYCAMLAEVLANTPPFATHGSAADRLYLARNGSLLRFQTGELVVRRGDVSDAMYVIKSGAAVVVLPDGRRIELLAPGFFGDIGILHHTARTADVVAGDAGLEAIRIGRFAIEGLLGRAPNLRRELFAISDDRLEELLSREPPARTVTKQPRENWLRSVGSFLRMLRPW